jgi:hypothetical protein
MNIGIHWPVPSHLRPKPMFHNEKGRRASFIMPSIA